MWFSMLLFIIKDFVFNFVSMSKSFCIACERSPLIESFGSGQLLQTTRAVFILIYGPLMMTEIEHQTSAVLMIIVLVCFHYVTM